MTLPASGQMTASMINVELGRSSTAAFDINGAAERALAGKASGVIKMSDFYGKSKAGIIIPPSRSWSKNFSYAGAASALCWLSILRDGTLLCRRGSAPTGEANFVVYQDNYYDPIGSTVGDNVWVRAVLIAGQAPNSSGSPDDPLNTWLNVGSDAPFWACEARTTSNGQSVQRSMTIRVDWSNNAGSSVVGSTTYTMDSSCEGNQ